MKNFPIEKRGRRKNRICVAKCQLRRRRSGCKRHRLLVKRCLEGGAREHKGKRLGKKIRGVLSSGTKELGEQSSPRNQQKG